MSASPRFVRIENVTRGTTVAERVRVASSSLDRSVGLLRTPEVKPGEGLWIERSPSIHMFFMPYAIDAVFVSKQGRVTKVAAEPQAVASRLVGARRARLPRAAGRGGRRERHAGRAMSFG